MGSAVVVATVDVNGGPHTAPFGSICFVFSKIMRFGCEQKHETYENIKRNGQVVVSLVAPPDNAVSIRGKARVAKSAWNL